MERNYLTKLKLVLSLLITVGMSYSWAFTIAVQLRNSDGNSLPDGNTATLCYRAEMADPWIISQNDGNGNFSISTTETSLTYKLVYNSGCQIKNEATSVNQILFTTVSISRILIDSKGDPIVNGLFSHMMYASGCGFAPWQPSNTPTEVLPGNYCFKACYNNGKESKNIQVNLSSLVQNVVFQTVLVSTNLIDSDGNTLTGGLIKHNQASGWSSFKDANLKTELLPGKYEFWMKYNYTNERRADIEISENLKSLDFVTVSVLLTLKDCNGNPVLGAKSQHKYGGWSHLNSANTLFELLPSTYSFRMYIDTILLEERNDIIIAGSFVEITFLQQYVANITEISVSDYCQGGVILSANSTNSGTYLWNTGETTQNILAYAPGTYTVTITSPNGCVSSGSYVLNMVLNNLISGYTIIASKEVHLHGDNTVVNGGVGVTENNKKAKIHDNTVITSPTTFVKADKIEINHGSLVSNAIYENPMVNLPQFLYSSTGTTNIKVNDNTTMTLSGSEFNKVEVKKNATLIFTQQDVSINELDAKDGATVKFSGCTYLRVKKKIHLHKSNSFNPDGFEVIVFIEKDKACIHEGTTFNGSIFTLKKEIMAKGKSNMPTYMNGLFISEKIKGQSYVNWDWSASCDTDCPAVSLNKTTHSNTIDNSDSEIAFKIIAYPNPFAGALNIEVESESESSIDIYIYDLSGRLMEKYTNMDELEDVKFGSDLAPGMYVIIVSQDNVTKTRKVIKM